MMTRSRALAVAGMPIAFGIVLIAADDVRVRAQEPVSQTRLPRLVRPIPRPGRLRQGYGESAEALRAKAEGRGLRVVIS